MIEALLLCRVLPPCSVVLNVCTTQLRVVARCVCVPLELRLQGLGLVFSLAVKPCSDRFKRRKLAIVCLPLFGAVPFRFLLSKLLLHARCLQNQRLPLRWICASDARQWNAHDRFLSSAPAKPCRAQISLYWA